MSTVARRRLLLDYERLKKDSPAGLDAAPTDEDLLKWKGMILGPQNTPFENGTFRITIEFCEGYPNMPPTVRFISKMFHPNIYPSGIVCLNILDEDWCPVYDVHTLLICIQKLLGDPNPNSPANQAAAYLYEKNRTEYNRNVRVCVEKSLEDLSS